MKGWLFTRTHEPLVLIEKEDPIAGPGQVVVDIKASGICGSDASALEHDFWMNTITGAPLFLGHECAGVVESVGEGVTNVKVGDRVAVEHTVNRDTNECIGITQDGGYATKVLVQDFQCIHMPDEVSFEEAASSTCAGQTAYHAVFTIGGAKPGMKVGIIGIGGLGQYGAGMAVAVGCEVYAVDINEDARALAEKLGCKKVSDNIMDFADDKLDVIVDYAGAGKTTSDAIKAVKRNGTVVLVGMAKSNVTLEDVTALNGIMIDEISLKGSCAGVASDISGIFEILKTGKFKLDITTIPFEELDKGVAMLSRGEVKGKLVAVQD